ncbi:SWIM zinc finger family protein [Hymenobacter jeollabukensis]|uniref:SWIM zinc finger family protein n=1 Tax=Hymenobacter jeollabukensis TaxID=2025313 RepID=A0A5R8WPF3_9BACT|nr:SWIM zinc finger family protein [Hymenobacter jeollabukensis]TLM91750.1 SWIM zinc finger family protein [Hymenobacter jeollabukensis]
MWTEDQARALVPDAGTLKRGLELATPPKWQHLGQTDTAAWGECQGSGAKPYQTGIDLTELAFKCSCPSRVFPCKHGAALLLLLARQPQLFGPAPPPPWLKEWLDKRQQTQAKKAAPAAAPAAPAEAPAPDAAPEPAPGVAVSAARLERMQRGAAELQHWLHDLIGAGLAQTEKRPASFWENQAARLVDDQLPGLATALRELPDLRHQGPDWPARQLARLGELYLLAAAFGRLAELPEALRADVLQLVGVNVKKDDVLGRQPAVADSWQVLGQVTSEEDRLLARRSWLWGQRTGRYALVLEYAFGGQAFGTALVPGGQYRGELAFYPGARALRAVVGSTWTFEGLHDDLLAPGLAPAELLDAYATALGQLPWLREWPATLAGVVPRPGPDGTVQLGHPGSGALLPLHPASELGWELLAVSGGYPITVFGEWDGRALLPITYTGAAAPSTPSAAP